MANISNPYAVAILNALFRGTPMTLPSAWYLALFKESPGPTGTGEEVTGGAYARQAIQCKVASIDAETGIATIKLTADVVFPIATTNWGTITHTAIYSAATGGSLITYSDPEVPKLIQAGDNIRISEALWKVTLQ